MRRFKYFLLAIGLMLGGCNNNQISGDDTPGTNHGSRVTNILFAHGFLADSDIWDHYVDYTEKYKEKVWLTYRTSISRSGSIKERAEELADYINAQNFSDDSVVAVGHSMGGLDLRYIISQGHINQSKSNKYYKAAKTIHKVYTIATPHKGVEEAKLDALGLSGGLDDLKPEHMRKFNEIYPYSTFSIDGRVIPMLAMRFQCNKDSDGTVKVSSQSLKDAPRTKTVFAGRHSSSVTFLECSHDSKEELKQDEIIKGILENKNYETEIDK